MVDGVNQFVSQPFFFFSVKSKPGRTGSFEVSDNTKTSGDSSTSKPESQSLGTDLVTRFKMEMHFNCLLVRR